MNIFKTCPRCLSTKVIKFVYGFPGVKLFELHEQGKVKIGGCCLEPDNPDFYCKDCEYEWTKQQATDAFYSYIKAIDLDIGGHDTDLVKININLIEKTIVTQLLRSRDESPYSYPLNDDNFLMLINALKYEIKILNWKRNYVKSEILDGVQWNMIITFTNALKPIEIYGSNDFPNEWDTLSLILSKLIPKKFYYYMS